jgi:sugar lactone lactonase YvrE
VTANVFNINVSCSKSTLSIGGSVLGLAAGQQVSILNNGADALIVNANGAFSFVTPVAYGSSYSVTVSAQPTGQTCSVVRGSSASVNANVANVSVNCASITFTVGGILSGLISSLTPTQQVTLYNNDSDPLIVSNNGAFVFPTPIAYGSNYSVSVGTQPSKQTCAVSNSFGVNVQANASNVTVLCQAMVWTVSTFTYLTNPYSITVAGTNLYAVEPVTSKIIKVALGSGALSELGGSGLPGYKDHVVFADPLIAAQNCLTLQQNCIYPWDAVFNGPSGVAVDTNGNVFVADSGNNVIRKIYFASAVNNGLVSTLAGSTAVGKANGNGKLASFNVPTGIAIDNNSPPNFYVTDTGNNLIRKISSAGDVTTFAGSGLVGKANGAALTASFNRPTGIALDILNNVYVVDSLNAQIRKITPQGVVSTLAGSGAVGYTNGLSDKATFFNPSGIAVDSSGNVYVADTSNNAIRAISQAGVVTTLAGSATGVAGNDGGVGVAARFNNPTGIAIAASGKIYVVEANNNAIRVISPTITPP